MNKTDPPRAFGVFKPAGHIVLAFDDQAKFDDCVERLATAADIGGDRLTTYTPEEMQSQAEQDLADAGALASIGQELNLVKVHLELAQRGSHFLVVQTDDDEEAAMVTTIATESGACLAQRYGKFMVEDLIDPARGANQVFESPDRGLDNKQTD